MSGSAQGTHLDLRTPCQISFVRLSRLLRPPLRRHRRRCRRVGESVQVDASLHPFPLVQDLLNQLQFHLRDRHSLLQRAFRQGKVVGGVLTQVGLSCALSQQLLKQNGFVRFREFSGR